jgi:hypothetical protein
MWDPYVIDILQSFLFFSPFSLSSSSSYPASPDSCPWSPVLAAADPSVSNMPARARRADMPTRSYMQRVPPCSCTAPCPRTPAAAAPFPRADAERPPRPRDASMLLFTGPHLVPLIYPESSGSGRGGVTLGPWKFLGVDRISGPNF